MRLHFNASRAHIGNRFPFLPISLLIIDRNSAPFRITTAVTEIPYQWRFPRPGVAMSSRAFNARFRYSIPARGFCVVAKKGEREKEKKRSELLLHNDACRCCIAYISLSSFEALGKTAAVDLKLEKI